MLEPVGYFPKYGYPFYTPDRIGPPKKRTPPIFGKPPQIGAPSLGVMSSVLSLSRPWRRTVPPSALHLAMGQDDKNAPTNVLKW